MKYELVVSDLDGTLLTKDMKISRENADAIEKMAKLGVSFAASSGRTLYEIPACVRELPAIRYLAYSNGTAVYDKELGRDVVSNRIPREDINAVLEVLKNYDCIIAAHLNGYSYFQASNTSVEVFDRYQLNGYYRHIMLDSKICDDIIAEIRACEAVEAIVLFFSNDEEIPACREMLEKLGRVTVTSSVEHNLELCSIKAGKGAGLRHLAAAIGVALEKTIAVGDNLNDTSMFAEAGLALCAGNGSNEAKALADEVICTVDEHTAEYVLNHYVK